MPIRKIMVEGNLKTSLCNPGAPSFIIVLLRIVVVFGGVEDGRLERSRT
jgi:hypothetical protein